MSGSEDEVQEEGEVQEEDELHPIFTRDPGVWTAALGRAVTVRLKTGAQHTGVLYTVDPVSATMVLATGPSSALTLHVMHGQFVEDFMTGGACEPAYAAHLDGLFRPPTRHYSAATLSCRKAKLRSWLLKNRVPIEVCKEDDAVLSLAGTLFIEPPYGAENCRSTNEIVLGRVQGLIEAMPREDAAAE